MVAIKKNIWHHANQIARFKFARKIVSIGFHIFLQCFNVVDVESEVVHRSQQKSGRMAAAAAAAEAETYDDDTGSAQPSTMET